MFRSPGPRSHLPKGFRSRCRSAVISRFRTAVLTAATTVTAATVSRWPLCLLCPGNVPGMFPATVSSTRLHTITTRTRMWCVDTVHSRGCTCVHACMGFLYLCMIVRLRCLAAAGHCNRHRVGIHREGHGNEVSSLFHICKCGITWK